MNNDMTIEYQCPICDSELKVHGPSQGYYCENRHRFDRHEQGYWVFAKPNNKSVTDPRQLMRAKRYLLESGIFKPVVDKMADMLQVHWQQVELKQSAYSQLDFDCGDGYYLRALAEALAELGSSFSLEQTGICEAENAIFAAAKSQENVRFLLAGTKKLPFTNDQFDLLTLVDKQLKGKECVRVLKPEGLLLQVSPGPRHLWQIKQHIYENLTEKPYVLSLPKELALVASEQVTLKVDVSPEQALTLLEMTPYAWRVKEKDKRKLVKGDFSELEFDFVINLARKL